MVNVLINFIKNNFIPESIIVRDNYSYNLLKEFEEKANIKVKIDKIRVIDVFIDSFMKGKK
jgi:polysaccharide pyruvyl transferase WcaK-like protein